MSRRLDLQGLRALAVLVVVINHATNSFLTGGYVGVDVFFVLSVEEQFYSACRRAGGSSNRPAVRKRIASARTAIPES